jgi:UDP-perosamine 4-acetyltransferase
MHKVVIVGSGGHAKVIIDVLNSSKAYKLVGCISSDLTLKKIMEIPVLGDDSILPRLFAEGIKYAFVAIGDNRKREELSKYVIRLGFEMINAISVYSYISSSAKLGKGIAVMPGAVINVDALIENNVIINTGATIDHDCVIGESSHIAPGCNIAGNVRVGKGTFLGVGCKVIPEITIGEWSTIGAGAVITNDLPEYSLAFGSPAKVIKKLQKEI